MVDLRDRLQSDLGERYRLGDELGNAGMSRVFLAQEVRLGREVVVKVLPPEMAAGVNRERFEREIQLAARLQHPHIVPLLSAAGNHDLLYYMMPRIRGESLRAWLARERPVAIGDAVRILREVADALAYAHAQGIVHRDIKPDNVLLSGKHAMVTDFGVAKAVAESSRDGALTSVGVAIGTPAYMAPEQALGDPRTDHRADIYSLGVVGYEMLAGRPLFPGLSAQQVLAHQITAAPDPLGELRDDVPAELADVVMRCLAKDPNDRYPSAEAVVLDLEGMATPLPTQLAVRHPLRAHPLRVAGLYAAAAIAVLAIAYVLMTRLGLPGWVMTGAIVLLAVGLPVTVGTAVVDRRRTSTPAIGWLTWRRTVRAVALALGGLALATGAYMTMRALGIGPPGTLVSRGVLGERERLVFADFENRTPDSTLGPSVTEALRVDLSQSPVVRLIDPTVIRAALGRMGRVAGRVLDVGTASELAQREGVKAVVHGQIDPLGRGYVLSAELIAAVDGTVLIALRETASDDRAIIGAVDRLSSRLRERIGESLKTIRASDPLEQVTTASLDALRRYSQAVKANDAGEYARAISSLEEAIQRDSTFAMAYRKLAVVLNNTGGSPSRIAAAATMAFHHSERLTPLERDLAEAFYYHRGAEFDRARVESAYRAALELDPENNVALNNLALSLNEVRRFAEAESLALRGIAVAPTGTLYFNATMAELGEGKWDDAARIVSDFTARAPKNPLTVFLRVRIADAQRDFAGAAAVAEEEARDQRDPAIRDASTSSLASLSLVRGKIIEAESQLRAAMDLAEARHLPGSYVGYAVMLGTIELRYADGPRAALHSVGVALQRHPLASFPAEDRPYLGLAWLYAQAGQPDRAKQALAEYAAAVPEAFRQRTPFRHGAAAAVAYAEGRVRDAISEYRAWYEEDSCAVCGLYYLGRAYERAGEADSALVVYARAINTPGMFRASEEAATLAETYRRLGELYEARGDRAKARDYYGRFLNLWKSADPKLQPAVRDVRRRLAHLTAEP